MNNSLIPADPERLRLVEYVHRRMEGSLPALPVLHGQASGIASTYIVARNGGGVGASMLILLLSHLLKEQPFVVQVGGLRSWAYRHLEEQDFAHFKIHEEAQVAGQLFTAPLDKRLEHYTRPSLLEYDQSLPLHAIDAVNLMNDQLGAHAVLCLVGAANDDAFRLADTARAHGVQRLLLFRERHASRNKRGDVIQIPTVPSKLAAHLRERPSDFGNDAAGWFAPVAAMTFRKNLQEMAASIMEARDEFTS